MALFKYLKQETATLPDKRTWVGVGDDECFESSGLCNNIICFAYACISKIIR